ncbi:MAG: hypothetical protein FWH35_02575, partial [Treponema sp.]|nr:hypothetical protein [Treponema sp.]
RSKNGNTFSLLPEKPFIKILTPPRKNITTEFTEDTENEEEFSSAVSAASAVPVIDHCATHHRASDRVPLWSAASAVRTLPP